MIASLRCLSSLRMVCVTGLLNPETGLSVPAKWFVAASIAAFHYFTATFELTYTPDIGLEVPT